MRSETARANIPIPQTIARIVWHAEQEGAAVLRYLFGQSSIRTAKSRGHYNYPSDLTDDEWAPVGPLISGGPCSLPKSIHDVSVWHVSVWPRTPWPRSSAQFPHQSINKAHLIVLGHLRINRKQ